MALNQDPSTPRSQSRQDASYSRIIKKRETDRLAQRANRERTKQRIITLQEEVNRLKSENQNAAFLELMKTVEDQRRQNEELQSSLSKIRAIVNGGGKTIQAITEPSRTTNIVQRQESSSSDDEPLITEMGSVTPTAIPNDSPRRFSSSTESLSVVDPMPIDSWLMMASIDDNLTAALNFDTNSALSFQPPFPYDPYQGLTFLPLAPDELKWDVSNDAFLRTLGSGSCLLGPDLVDPHVPFRAILWGWHTVDAQEREHPIWNMLRLIDERVFGLWTSKTQKLALMFITHTLIKYRLNPTPENLERMPTWFRSRPSQDRVPHPPVIDLLLWPGLRDRLVFEHPEYTKTGEFSSFYCNHLHFYWPFSEDMIYTFDHRTKRFQISQKFKEYAFDLRNWTMDRTFLARYPELKHDIPTLEDRVMLEDRIARIN